MTKEWFKVGFGIMQQFDYVLLAYGVALLTFSWVAYLIIRRDRKLRQLLNKLAKGN